MRKDKTKIGRGICKWPRCQAKAVGGRPEHYKDNSWVRGLYCPKHGAMAEARRDINEYGFVTLGLDDTGELKEPRSVRVAYRIIDEGFTIYRMKRES